MSPQPERTRDRGGPAPRRPLHRGDLLWLALGVVLVIASQMRWGIGALAWLAPVPFLRYVRATSGWRARLALGGAVALAWSAATMKIVTAPVPAVFGAALGIAFATGQLVALSAWGALRRRASPGWAIAAFAAAQTVVEWLQHRFTPLSSWGAAAYTQIDDLPVLQIASIFGIAGLSLLVNGVAAALEEALSRHLDRDRARTPASVARPLVAAAIAVAAAHAFGVVRLALPREPGLVRVAAVGTIATFPVDGLPDAAGRERIVSTLEADTRAAARAGARLVVWNEAAALAWPDEEAELVARAAALARAESVHLVAAYIVPRSEAPLSFENKYAWLGPTGAVEHEYHKHHPAPGEPAVVGTEPLVAVDADFGRLGGALCYDYDYPALAARHGALGVDLVALPSSDWRGIDPIHTQMAALRAIEQGTSIVRSTRFGLSAAIDPLGRLRAWQSSFDGDSRILVATLPRHHVVTWYSRIGDVAVWASAALLVALAATGARRRLSTSAPATGPSAAR